MKIKLIDVAEDIFAGGDVPKDRFSEIVTDKYKIPIYANAEKDNGLYGYTDVARVSVPCVTVAARGTIGFTAKRTEPFLPVVRLITVIPNGEKITLDYLYYALRNCRPKSSGTSIPQLTVPDIKNYSFEIASISRQEKITRILDEIERLIERQRKQMDCYDRLIKSRFVEMFGDPVINSMRWPKTSIGENCFVTKLAGFEYTRYIKYEDNGEVVMVKAQNVKNGKINRKELSYISNEVSDSLPRSQLAPGDIVMTYVGANIGDVAVIDNKYKYHLAPNVAKIRPNSQIYNSIFFMYMLMFLNAYIVKNSADTAKAALGMERIRKLNVFVPPIELQDRFAAFVPQVDKLRFATEKSLNETQQLFDSLMQKYFG